MPFALPNWLKLLKGNIEEDNDEAIDMLFDGSVGGDITSHDFGHAIMAIKPTKKINLLINSLGGAVHEGVAMHNLISARGNVHCVVVGVAASMGSILAQAGARRSMMPGTGLFIHNPTNVIHGDYRDNAQNAEFLKTIRNQLVDLYSTRSKQSKKVIADMMDKGTYMSPKEAQGLGFTDEILENGAPAWNAVAQIPDAKSQEIISIFRSVSNATTARAAVDDPKQKNSMTKLLALLARLALIASADATEDQAIAQLESNHKTLTANATKLQTDLTAAQAKITSFETAQKARVTAKVGAAVTAKVVKDTRKNDLIAIGERSEQELDVYLADITEARGATQQRRGGPPVPLANGDTNDKDAQIRELQGKLATANASDKVEISRQLRELRGHGSMFGAPAATKAP